MSLPDINLWIYCDKYGCNCLKYIFPKEVCLILHSTCVFMSNYGCEVKYNQNLGQMLPSELLVRSGSESGRYLV